MTFNKQKISPPFLSLQPLLSSLDVSALQDVIMQPLFLGQQLQTSVVLTQITGCTMLMKMAVSNVIVSGVSMQTPLYVYMYIECDTHYFI